ncbi:hypothetical protein RYX36_018555 [Vicia faba]
MGGARSSILVHGFSWLYGSSGGEIELQEIVNGLINTQMYNSPGILIALICITVGIGFKLSPAPSHQWTPDVYEGESGPCLSPSVADHPLGPSTDHRLGKLLPHQLANQTQAPPWVDSSFRSSAYGVLAAVSSCCPTPKGRFLHVTHLSATGNTISRLTCMCKACRQRSS